MVNLQWLLTPGEELITFSFLLHVMQSPLENPIFSDHNKKYSESFAQFLENQFLYPNSG